MVAVTRTPLLSPLRSPFVKRGQPAGGTVTPPTDLLSGLSWTAGASTTLTQSGGFARATATATSPNPRIFKGPFTLTINKTYQMVGKVYERTAATNLYFRISLSSALSSADFYQNTVGAVGGTLDLTGITYTAGQTSSSVYLGIIPAVGSIGEYGEIDQNFQLLAL